MELDILRFEEFLDRHEKVVLQFSSGKDSRACLELIRPYLKRITVMWANSGNPYPEVVEYMDDILLSVPNFVELVGEQPGWVIEHGMPVDVLPVSAGHFGLMMGTSVPKLQPFNACCGHNLWEPMAKFVIEGGYTGIIRGQKASDKLKPPFKHGDVFHGLEFYHPLENATDSEVIEFLGDDIPGFYKRGLTSSLDCLNCSAFVGDDPKRLPDLDLIYPPAAKQIRTVQEFMKAELSRYLENLNG